jgi:hypothetical protein
MPARAIRQDRMVGEAIATDGDLRRICDLFGVTIATAQHYAGSPFSADSSTSTRLRRELPDQT